MIVDIIAGIARRDPVLIARAIEDIAFSLMGGLSNLFALGIEALTTGFTAFSDDIKDIWRFDRVHHWLIGLAILIAGIVILIISLLMGM